MNTEQTGRLIAALRKENGLTQGKLAQTLHVSVQAVSKWERGLGCPDVSVLPLLAEEFGVPVERLLAGDLTPSDKETGNMKRLKFYVCPTCGNLLTAAGPAEVHCCGRKLAQLVPQKVDGCHAVRVEPVEDEWYLTFDHPMEKGHFIRFFAYVGYDRYLLVRLYPEQSGELRMPQMHGGKLYACCSRDGLFEVNV
ncbi:MAG: helix-turn-helix domain-containing protein [Oscillibacter sp.]|jgi:DNA-binding XRE family transcriptional regulator|nr:helix-turn-helix domain-containing protein [Oscillibacter sp.]